MNKTDLLFQMMEQPHAYTDQQWQDILSDEECRELYTLMAKTQRVFDTQKEIDDETIDVEWKRLSTSSSRRWLRVAVMFIGVLMISGITIAAVHLVRNAVGVDTKAPTQETPITDSHQSALPIDLLFSIMLRWIALPRILQPITTLICTCRTNRLSSCVSISCGNKKTTFRK